MSRYDMIISPAPGVPNGLISLDVARMETVMTADFSRIQQHLASNLVEHADRDGLTGVKRAVFLDRGMHAPGEVCPTAAPKPEHEYWCQWPDDECACGWRP